MRRAVKILRDERKKQVALIQENGERKET